MQVQKCSASYFITIGVLVSRDSILLLLFLILLPCGSLSPFCEEHFCIDIFFLLLGGNSRINMQYHEDVS